MTTDTAALRSPRALHRCPWPPRRAGDECLILERRQDWIRMAQGWLPLWGDRASAEFQPLFEAGPGGRSGVRFTDDGGRPPIFDSPIGPISSYLFMNMSKKRMLGFGLLKPLHLKLRPKERAGFVSFGPELQLLRACGGRAKRMSTGRRGRKEGSERGRGMLLIESRSGHRGCFQFHL